MTKTLVLLISIIALVFCHNPYVKIPQGLVKGIVDSTPNNRIFFSFTGIPYAKPPIGSLRLEPPEELPPWTGVFDATNSHERCMQYMALNDLDNTVGSEDCLYINVYTPQVNVTDKKLLPVMFYVHGGGFIEGSGKKELWGPKYLLEKDIVLVAPNYRLGPFGFLSTGDTVLPGNIGLKDQAFALQWTKKNIIGFGGDPEKITVFGHSAGGFGAHSLMFSPLSRDIIKGVIAQSGNVLSPWGILPTNVALNRTRFMAEKLNCGKDLSTADIKKCLKKFTADDILKAAKPLLEEKLMDASLFRPVLEPDHCGAFWTKHPIDLLKSGKVTDMYFMAGAASEDGAIISGSILSDPNLIDIFNKNFDELIPMPLYYADDRPIEEQRKLSKAIKAYYLKENDIGNSTTMEFTQMCTDRCFLSPAQESVSLHAKYLHKNVYNYLFSYKGSKTFGSIYYGANYDFGVVHADELLYLFNSEELFPGYKLTQKEKEFSDTLISYWTNFATFGTPTPGDNAWRPYQSNKENYFLMKNDFTGVVQDSLRKEQVEFWKPLFKDDRKLLEDLHNFHVN